MKIQVKMRRSTWAWKKDDVLTAKTMEVEGVDMAWLELPNAADAPHQVHGGGIWAQPNEYEQVGFVDETLDETEVLMEKLSILLAPRGSRVDEWPEDEAEAYRRYRFNEGNAEVQRLRYRKAAEALLAEYKPRIDKEL